MKKKLQVFVSSTFLDLTEERQAAVAAILKAGHIPAGMELFTSGDKSQMETIQRWIDESDVYMLILGGRYGSIEKTSGLSYTELEYDYAIKAGKPLFAVVTKEDALESKVRARGTEFIEKENPQHLKNFREKVLSNVSSFFSDEKDVKLCVYESLSDYSYNTKLHGWISGADIEDTAMLHEEIRTLRSENEVLRAQLEQAEKVSRSRSGDQRNHEIQNVIDVLGAIEIEVPASVNYGEEVKESLLMIFYMNRNLLISGVTNQANTSEAERFFYFTICPALQIHGLTDNEKIAGVRYRRSYVTKLGLEVLAECERRVNLKKDNPTQA